MAVSTNNDIGTLGRYVPYRTPERAGEDGGDPVGTLSIAATATGAAGGGTVTVVIRMRRTEFGFRLIWVPTYISVVDNLATAEVVLLGAFGNPNNERLAGAMRQSVLPLAGAGALNVGSFTQLGVAVEPETETISTVLTGEWSTNTDTKVYFVHAYGVCYDAEVIAREGRISELLAGLR